MPLIWTQNCEFIACLKYHILQCTENRKECHNSKAIANFIPDGVYGSRAVNTWLLNAMNSAYINLTFISWNNYIDFRENHFILCNNFISFKWIAVIILRQLSSGNSSHRAWANVMRQIQQRNTQSHKMCSLFVDYLNSTNSNCLNHCIKVRTSRRLNLKSTNWHSIILIINETDDQFSNIKIWLALSIRALYCRSYHSLCGHSTFAPTISVYSHGQILSSNIASDVSLLYELCKIQIFGSTAHVNNVIG